MAVVKSNIHPCWIGQSINEPWNKLEIKFGIIEQHLFLEMSFR